MRFENFCLAGTVASISVIELVGKAVRECSSKNQGGMILEACAASAPTECNHECRVKDRRTVCARKRGVLVVKVTSSTLSLPLTKGILLAIAGTKPFHIREPSGGPQSALKVILTAVEAGNVQSRDAQP